MRMYNKQTLVCEDKVGKRGYRITQTVTVEKLLYPEKYPELKPPGTSGLASPSPFWWKSHWSVQWWKSNVYMNKHKTLNITSEANVSSIQQFIRWKTSSIIAILNHLFRINWWQISTFLMLSRMDHISKRRALHYFNSFHLGHLTRDLASHGQCQPWFFLGI